LRPLGDVSIFRAMNDQQAKILLQAFEPNGSPAEASLYVEPPDGLPGQLADELLDTAETNRKFLLIGGRGLGKSATLRRVGRLLGERDVAIAVEIDLDRMGIGAMSVGAFDLTYVIGLAILARLPKGSERTGLGERLLEAYGGAQKKSLGELDEILSGVAGFAVAASELAVDSATVPGGAAGVKAAAVLAAPVARAGIKGFVRLVSRLSGEIPLVAESSPEGRGVLGATAAIAAAARAHFQDRPLVVLLDGLEKVNGGGLERVEELFEHTQLMANGAWNALIAAPPAVLSTANALQSMGFETRPVLGFVGHPEAMHELLRKRLTLAGGDVYETTDSDGLSRLVAASGGSPRSALWMAYYAVRAMRHQKAAALTGAAIDEGIARLSTELNSGLSDEDLQTLAEIATRRRPNERATRMFASERILAQPPARPGAPHTYDIHPLLRAQVEEWRIESGQRP
jgi:hypothetical protein